MSMIRVFNPQLEVVELCGIELGGTPSLTEVCGMMAL